MGQKQHRIYTFSNTKSSSKCQISLNKMSDSGVGEESSGQVAEKLNPGNVLPHLRCSKCQDFFRGQVFGCTNNHATCSLCCGVDIKSGDEEDVDEEGMEVEEDDSEDESDDVDCPVEDCKSKTSISCTGKNLTQIVGNLRMKVPCKNRDAGCPHKCVEDEMEEH